MNAIYTLKPCVPYITLTAFISLTLIYLIVTYELYKKLREAKK
jgi:hypothetical protein